MQTVRVNALFLERLGPLQRYTVLISPMYESPLPLQQRKFNSILWDALSVKANVFQWFFDTFTNSLKKCKAGESKYTVVSKFHLFILTEMITADVLCLVSYVLGVFWISKRIFRSQVVFLLYYRECLSTPEKASFHKDPQATRTSLSWIVLVVVQLRRALYS